MTNPQRGSAGPERVIAYVDGFSFYHGLKHKGWRHLMWLDYHALAQSLITPSQELLEVQYFTSRVRKPVDSRRRQGVYLDALQVRGEIVIIEGKFEHRPQRCNTCGSSWDRPKEKMTDVQLALALVADALDERYDTALLIAADADLVPAVALVRERFGKRIVIVSPRGRHSDELQRAGDASIHINDARLRHAQLPDPVLGPNRSYPCPSEWKGQSKP